jgi:hypothetical protein
MLRNVLLGLLGVCAVAAGRAEAGSGWSAGAAKVDITPSAPVWMAGYAARTTPSEGVTLPLQAKALALTDDRDHTIVLVTADLIGFDRALTGRVTDRLKEKYDLPREAVVLLASHTHTGPALKNVERQLQERGSDPKGAKNNLDYVRGLEDKLVALVGAALSKRGPAAVSYGVGRAEFAMNRREKTPKGFKIGINPNGPTDKSVPVLRVDDAKGMPLALVFGYACHNTTLTDKAMSLSGDYAGFTQAALEASHPGAVALFVTGCAGDANPEPRGTLELAKAHGRSLAGAVEAVLAKPMMSLSGSLRSAYAEPTVRFAGPTDRASYESRLKEPGSGRQAHARRMIAAIERGEPVKSEYPYPVQAFALGDRLTLLALAGEVVVDYAIRLQKELGGDDHPLWVAAYANDVFGYVPSVRVLNEGGYEGLEAFYYSSFPTPFAPDVESTVVNAARDVVAKVRAGGNGR